MSTTSDPLALMDTSPEATSLSTRQQRFQRHKERVERLIFYIRNGKPPPHTARKEVRNMRNQAKHHVWEEDKQELYYVGKGDVRKVVTDIAETVELLQQYHSAPRGSHSGINATLAKISLQYTWNGMKEDIIEYVASCEHCQRYSKLKTQAPELKSIRVDEPGELAGMDLIGARGHTAMLKSSNGRVKFVQGITMENPELIKGENPEEETIHDAAPSPGIAHESTESFEKSYKCIICDTSFLEYGDLKEHLRTHIGDKPYKCTLCKASFFESDHMERHMRTHSEDKTFTCSLCESSFSKSDSLNRHIRTHTGEKPYRCTLCQTSFSESSSLKKHLVTHTGDKPYKCNLCESSFSLSCTLKRHMRIHTGDRPYKCTLCESSFSDSGYLKRHMRTHAGYKPYKCTLCESSFSESSNLKSHMRTHNGDKPFKCTLCGSLFSESGHMKRHMRTHTGDKPYKCTLCESSFYQSSSLKSHMRTHTGDKPYECILCESSFSLAGSLKRHMRSHMGDKPYKCTLCESSFTESGNMKRHMRIHTGEKPHRCMICEATFSHSNSLKNHLRTHKNACFSNEEFGGCNLEIPTGGSQPLPRHEEPFSIMSCAQEVVKEDGLKGLVNISGSSRELTMSQVKEEIKVEVHGIDEMTV